MDQRQLFDAIGGATSTKIWISLCFEVKLNPVGRVWLRYNASCREHILDQRRSRAYLQTEIMQLAVDGECCNLSIQARQFWQKYREIRHLVP